MNPGIDNTPGLGFTQPSAGMGQAPIPSAPGFTQPAVPPSVNQPQFQQPIPSQQPVAPLPPELSHQATHFAGDPHVAPSAEGVEDSALDDEWVNKAKEVVARTQTDPYLQSKEITRLRAQYVKLRYNKDMKVIEDNK